MTDRSIDRSYGIWANNVDVHAPVGLISTNETAYITWQDTRPHRHRLSPPAYAYTTAAIFWARPAVGGWPSGPSSTT